MSEGNFEAKLYSVRKSKDGMIVAFVVQPHDTAGLINLDIGAHLMIGWSEIAEIEAAACRGSVQGQVEPAGDTGFSAASNDHVAQLEEHRNSTPMAAGSSPAVIAKKPRTPFHDLSPVQQAVLRCDNLQFRTFMDTANSEECARAVREHCGVASRADLSSNQNALMRWRQLSEEFERWALTQRYKDIIR